MRIDIFSTRRLPRTGLFAAGRSLRHAGAGHGLLLAWVETQVAEARAAAEGRTSWAKFGGAALPWAEGLPHGPKLEAHGPSSQQADARGLGSSGRLRRGAMWAARSGFFAAGQSLRRARAGHGLLRARVEAGVAEACGHGWSLLVAEAQGLESRSARCSSPRCFAGRGGKPKLWALIRNDGAPVA